MVFFPLLSRLVFDSSSPFSSLSEFSAFFFPPSKRYDISPCDVIKCSGASTTFQLDSASPPSLSSSFLVLITILRPWLWLSSLASSYSSSSTSLNSGSDPDTSSWSSSSSFPDPDGSSLSFSLNWPLSLDVTTFFLPRGILPCFFRSFLP